ncbi:hypothetical protein ACFVXC_15260 [Streptomyces sp. NPDC058257]|uniref:hypothetical protein n=1 Tax=Streptomyces sp. NPDC058257 TaxID=3346409 RepID=UPI0036EF187F
MRMAVRKGSGHGPRLSLRFEPRFTPAGSSWINRVERWFDSLARFCQRISGAGH